MYVSVRVSPVPVRVTLGLVVQVKAAVPKYTRLALKVILAVAAVVPLTLPSLLTLNMPALSVSRNSFAPGTITLLPAVTVLVRVVIAAKAASEVLITVAIIQVFLYLLVHLTNHAQFVLQYPTYQYLIQIADVSIL